jgi:hypothetical protein
MDFNVARTQRSRNLETDEAGTHHYDAPGGAGAFDDRTAIAKRTQRANVRLVGTRNRQPNRLCARR